MKHSKSINAAVGAAILLMALCVGVRLHSMKPFTFTQKSRGRTVPIELSLAERTKDAPRHKSEIIWVKTSDDKVLELPQWQIDQSKVLQVIFVHQKGSNSKDNPVNASMVTSEQLVVLQEALQKASDLEIFRKFYISLSGSQQKSLLVDAFTLEMQGLASLIISYMFPIEVQQQMGAGALQQAGIIAPVVKYLTLPEIIPLSHTGSITEVAFSPDGNRIISAAYGIDHNVILYDFKNGKEIKNLVEEPFPQPCVVFSSDGNYIATGSLRESESLILWDGITGAKIKTVSDFPVKCMTFGPQGTDIFAGISLYKDNFYYPALYSGNHYPTLTRGLFGKELFEGFQGSMDCVALRPDSDDIVLGSGIDPSISDNLVLYNCKTGKKIRSFVGLSQGVPHVAFSPDGKYILGATKELMLWDAQTGKELKKIEHSLHSISAVALHPSADSIVVVSGIDVKKVVVFDYKTGDFISESDAWNWIGGVAFSPDGYSLLCGVTDFLSKRSMMLFKFINKKDLDFIATQLNLAQARLLYRLYVAKINHVPVILDTKDLDYQIFKTLPVDIQKVVKVFLPFELASNVAKNIAEKTVQEKMKELKASLFYHTSRFWQPYEKTHDEKVKAVKDAMQNFEEDSIAYKACEQLLLELEREAAFM